MNRRRLGGFALPTVLVASMIMLVVLLSAVSSTATVRSAIRDQYYSQLSRTAADSGSAYAQSCLSASNNVPTWSDADPLTPGTDCTGTQLAGFNCSTTPTDPRCVVSVNSNVVSTFSVGLPATKNIGWSVKNSDNQNTTISLGNYHSCAISFDKQAYCWGTNTQGQLGSNDLARRLYPSIPISIGGVTGSKVKSITAGDSHTCAIAYTGKAYCWGYNLTGQMGNNTKTDSTIPFAVDTTNLTGDKTFKMISAGLDHTCGIASNNKAYCWGDNTYGQLGIGTSGAGTGSVIPVSVVLAGKTFISISAGNYFTCGIVDGGLAYCWGLNTSYQLGDTTTTLRNVPTAVSVAGVLASKTVLALSSGQSHTCVIAAGNATDSLTYCWGLNGNGQLGDGSTTVRTIPVAVSVTGALAGLASVSISAGGKHTCMTASNNLLYCWGLNTSGQVGDASNTQRTSAVAVSTAAVLGSKTIQNIATGVAHSCAIASDGQMYCWGINTDGTGGSMLGNNSSTNINIPVAVTTGSMPNNKSISVVSKGQTAIFRASTGSARKSYYSYTKFNSNSRAWKQISPGSMHICAITNDGKAYCWGDNSYGQLGNNTTIDSSKPTPVYMAGALSGKTIISISAGDFSTCAIASDNNAYCWGSNGFGQLGDNTTAVGAQSTVPVAVYKTDMANKTVKSISVGSAHACAIASTGLAYCWGSNSNGGQLGNSNLNNNSNKPVAVTTSGVLSGLTLLSISAGYHHTCAVGSNNLAYCWGSNRNKDNDGDTGQVGNNNASPTNPAPVAVNTAGVLSGKNILSVLAGQYTSCATASDSLTYCWGYDGFGALGNDDIIATSFVPVLALASPGGTVSSVSTGRSNVCSITWNSSLYCWGDNTQGQVGDNSGVDQPVPVVSVSSLGYIASLSVSNGNSWTTCALTYSAKSYCWGALIEPNGTMNGDILSLVKSMVPIEIASPPVSIY